MHADKTLIFHVNLYMRSILSLNNLQEKSSQNK